MNVEVGAAGVLLVRILDSASFDEIDSLKTVSVILYGVFRLRKAGNEDLP